MIRRTIVTNQGECGYQSFFTLGAAIYARGYNKANKLHIRRVTFDRVDVDTREDLWSFINVFPATKEWDVDLTIYTDEGEEICVHTTDESFIRKMYSFSWERNTKATVYSDVETNTPRKQSKMRAYDQEKIGILLRQIENEQLILEGLQKVEEKAREAFEADPIKCEIHFFTAQKRVLACEKRILNYKQQIERLQDRIERNEYRY